MWCCVTASHCVWVNGNLLMAVQHILVVYGNICCLHYLVHSANSVGLFSCTTDHVQCYTHYIGHCLLCPKGGSQCITISNVLLLILITCTCQLCNKNKAH